MLPFSISRSASAWARPTLASYSRFAAVAMRIDSSRASPTIPSLCWRASLTMRSAWAFASERIRSASARAWLSIDSDSVVAEDTMDSACDLASCSIESRASSTAWASSSSPGIASLMSSISSNTSPRGTTQPAVMGTPRASSTMAPNSSSASKTRYTAMPSWRRCCYQCAWCYLCDGGGETVCRGFARRRTKKPQRTGTGLLVSREIHPKHPFTPTPRAEPPREVFNPYLRACRSWQSPVILRQYMSPCRSRSFAPPARADGSNIYPHRVYWRQARDRWSMVIITTTRSGGTSDRQGATGHLARIGGGGIDDMGDHLGADPGLRPLGSDPGRGAPLNDREPDGRRPAPHAGGGNRAGSRVVVMLLCRGGSGPITIPQRRQLHCRHGVRDRFHQSRGGVRHHPGSADGLAVHRRGVHRRPADDRRTGGAVPAVRALPSGGRRA